MRTWHTILTLFAFVLGGCGISGSRSGRVIISDVTKTNELNLVSSYTAIGGELPRGISLRVHSKINGTAYIYAGNGETTELRGVVEWRIYHDWFRTNCVLHYVPGSVRSGLLTIDYTIH